MTTAPEPTSTPEPDSLDRNRFFRAERGSPALSRTSIEARSDRILAPGGPLKARLIRFRWGDRSWILKDISHTPLWYRLLLGRRMLQREFASYERLSDLRAIPHSPGMLDRDGLVIEHIEGQPLARGALPPDPARFFDRLARVIDTVHARGIAHLDLRHKRNVLVGADGRPHLIDFAQSVDLRRGPRWGPLFPLFRRLDRSAIVKYRARYCPESLTEVERAAWHRYERFRPLWIFSGHRRRQPGLSSHAD